MQVLYNVTVSIDVNCEQEWRSWMRSVHIPDVMATGCFVQSWFSRLNGSEEEGGATYAITYVARSKEDMDRYTEQHAPALQLDHSEKFNGRFAAFRTMLDVIEHYQYAG